MGGVPGKRNDGTATAMPAAVSRPRLDPPVDVRGESGRIADEPLRPVRYDIEALVAGITEDNRHYPPEASPPVGREFQ